MSGTVAVCVASALTTAATVVIATLPEARDLLTPLSDGGEYAIGTVSVLASFPIVALLTALIAGSSD